MPVFLKALAALLLRSPDVEIRRIETTPTQAILTFETPAPAACAVRIYTDEAMSILAHDSDEALYSGAQACNREGSIVDGNRVVFVAGARRAQKAADGRFYSRALAAYRRYYYQIESAGRVKTGSFQTANIPLGKLYGEPYPFDREAPGRYGWPTIDWADKSREYVDPLTGAVLKRLSSPRQAYPDLTKPADGVAAFDSGSGAWSDPSSATAPDGRAARYSGAANEPLFVRAPQVCPDGWGCERAARWDIPYRAVDDVEVSIKAWCSSAACLENASGAREAAVCLTTDGVSCATPWKAITVGTSSGDDPVPFPQSFPSPVLSGWLGAGAAPVARPDMATHEGKVNVNGREVTWASGHYFNVGAWKAGSRIRIAAEEYVIERVNGATSLTLSTGAGSQNGAAYQANNFGVLIRKSSPGAAVLEVDSVSFRIATSHEYEMPASGSWDFCSPNKVTDPAGKEGFLCRVNTAANYPTLWFIAPSDGEGRFLGVISVPYNLDTRGNSLDGNEGACFGGTALGRDDPNEIYCISRSNASPNQGLLIFRGRYLPEGRAGCAQPAGYQAIDSGEACNIEWEMITRPSAGTTLLAKARKFNPEFDPARYPYAGLFSSQGGALGFYAWAGQDTMAWSIWLDQKTFDILSMQNYHSSQPCRFCAAHSFLQMGDGQYNAVVVKDFAGGSETNAGPYDVNVSAPLALGDFRVCPTDIDDRFKQMGATGVRCVTLTISGDPCDSSPSDWERANRPACPWQPGAITLQPIQEGDEAIDGAERFLFVKKLSATQWIVVRNHQVMHGPTLKERTSTAIAHPAGWKLRMACGAATSSGYAWVRFTTGGQMLRDNGLSRAEHGDVSTLGNVMSAYDATTDRFGRFFWNRPIPDRVGTAADARVLAGRGFGGVSVHEAPVFRDYIQTHPSWRQVTAPEGERRWYLDGNPFANQSGGVYTLWPQQAAHVSGSLYKLGALAAPLARKVLPVVAWSGRNHLEEVSGPQSKLSGEPDDNWKYCVADFAGECVSGSRAGEVYLNVPAMTNDGRCGNSFFFHRPCFTSMVNPGIGIAQYGAVEDGGTGTPDRFLTGHLQRYNATWTYSNAAPLPDGSWALIGGSWLEGARNELLLLRLPAYPEKDPVDRSQYIPVRLEVPHVAGATRARVRFGYGENGRADRYFCTSRQEPCVTGGQPFGWAGEPQALEHCPAGCSFLIPAISGRVLNFIVDWFDDSRNLVRTGGRGAIAVP